MANVSRLDADSISTFVSTYVTKKSQVKAAATKWPKPSGKANQEV